MADGQMIASAPTNESGGAVANKREQSTIGFPYTDLENAISVAKALYNSGAAAITRDQLAAATGLAAGSGNFVIKLGAARLFGLIESEQGKLSLTDLGHEIINPARERAARVQAFYNVPLYKRLYDDCKGKPLPPRPHGLENRFVDYGVSSKQKDKARQAFEKSATQAGFFAAGNDRLVEPIIPVAQTVTLAPAQEPRAEVVNPVVIAGGTPTVLIDNDLIRGLFYTLPDPGDVWPEEDRKFWLGLADNIFRVIYKKAPKDGGEGQGS